MHPQPLLSEFGGAPLELECMSLCDASGTHETEHRTGRVPASSEGSQCHSEQRPSMLGLR